MAKSLGLTAYRFSIEWSRIEPEEGKFDEKEIEHYRAVIRACRARGIEPFVTLWHWTLPLWIARQGGVESKEFPKYFARYAERMALELKDDIRFLITINEPMVYTSYSYWTGDWPPMRKGVFVYLKAIRNLATAHQVAYRAIKSIQPSVQVGIAKNNIYFEVKERYIFLNKGNYILRDLANWWWNYRFLNMIKNYQDFIGLNFYFHNRISWRFGRNENKEVSDMGWELYPESIYHTLKFLKGFNIPIYITENGVADARDTVRAEFIKNHVKYIRRAMDEGVDVRGYFYWSLLDNFEWDKGFWPRFGLVEIDYKTMERRVRQSAWEYARLIQEQTEK